MKYLIFSDESGSWHEGEYYIRSWIRITPENYDLLRKEIIFTKHETGIKELKWKHFKSNYDKCKYIFDVTFDIFMTISRPKHFQSRKYHILDHIEKVPISTGGEALTEQIKKKILNSAKNELFLNYFEKTHIKNSKDALIPKDCLDDYIYIIDAPQYLPTEWIEIANECGIKQIKVEKTSENCPGLELADITSGCVMDFLAADVNAQKVYQECMKKKMMDMTSKLLPNPNLIFHGDFSEQEKKEANIFR